MIIAITSHKDNKQSTLDERFGRCAYFAIYNSQTEEIEYVENPNKKAAEGAGPASVQLIAEKGVQKIVSGHFGGKAKTLLDSLKIQMVMFDDSSKTIDEIIKLINN